MTHSFLSHKINLMSPIKTVHDLPSFEHEYMCSPPLGMPKVGEGSYIRIPDSDPIVDIKKRMIHLELKTARLEGHITAIEEILNRILKGEFK